MPRPDHQAGGRGGEIARSQEGPQQIKSGMKFKTVIGDLSYDKKGDVTRLDYVIYVWKKIPAARSPTPKSSNHTHLILASWLRSA
jgi:hypothetical protein